MVALNPPVCDFGRAMPGFKLPGVDGREYSFEECCGPRGTVVMFLCNHCPFVVASIDRIVLVATVLQEIGVASVAIMSNDTVAYPDDSFPNMQRWARRWQLPFPYLFDESQDTARAWGAVCTPDYFGLNAAGLLQYRGRLDAGRTGPLPPDAGPELLQAMQQIAATGAGPEEQQASIGCSLKWRAPA